MRKKRSDIDDAKLLIATGLFGVAIFCPVWIGHSENIDFMRGVVVGLAYGHAIWEVLPKFNKKRR